jgi:predicted nucleic acid-binding protein
VIAAFPSSPACPQPASPPTGGQLGLRLFVNSTRLSARDALHAATALNRGVPTIVSPDEAFDDVPQLERIDPLRAAARL